MENKFLDRDGLLYFFQKLKSLFVAKETGKGLSTNDYTTMEKEKLSGIETNANNYKLPIASASMLGGVKVGAGLNVSGEGVLSATGGGTADAVDWANVQSKPTTISGYGITDAYTKSETYSRSELDGKLSSVYKPAGSVSFSELPTPGADNLGNVYDVTDEFTTDARFINPTPAKYPIGTNVVVIQRDGNYYFDILAGFIDLSGFLKIGDISAIANSEIDSIVTS